jgi:hypothetical protein
MRHVSSLLVLGLAACGGRVDTVPQIGAPDDSGTGVVTPIATANPVADAAPDSSASTGSPDASTTSTVDGGTAPAVGYCNGAPTVGLGGTIHGTTCGKTHVGEAICQFDNPDAFFYVGAPAGASLHLVLSSPNGSMVVMGFPSCDAPSATECTSGSTFDPDPGMRLFEVETADQACGEFSVTVTGG